MRKVFCIVVFFLMACSTSPESVGKEAGQMTCASMKLLKKALTGDVSAKDEGEKLKKKAEELKKKIESFDDEGKRKAAEAMIAETKNCMSK